MGQINFSDFTPVGLDLSLTSTGYSCNDVQIAVRSKYKGPQRLYDIWTQVWALMTEVNNPVAIIEGYSFASRNSQAHSIGELGGVIRMNLWLNEIHYVDVPPTVRAKFATGKGNAGKGEVMSSVSARTGIVWSGAGADDMCDAWILEEIGRSHANKERFSWPANNLSALEKIQWEGTNK